MGLLAPIGRRPVALRRRLLLRRQPQLSHAVSLLLACLQRLLLSSFVSPPSLHHHHRALADDVLHQDVTTPKKNKDSSMESTIMCTFDGHAELDVVDWVSYFELLKSQCSYQEMQFRILCGVEAVAWSSFITEQVARDMRFHEYNLLCPNGVAQAASIALAHNTSHHLQHRWVLKEALQKSYVLDNSKWHVKTVDALELLTDTYVRRGEIVGWEADNVPSIANQRALFGDVAYVPSTVVAGGNAVAAVSPPPPALNSYADVLRANAVTIIAPFADASSAPSFGDLLLSSADSPGDRTPLRFLYPEPQERELSLGAKLNYLSERVETEFALVVASELIPSYRDLQRLLHVLRQDDGYLSAVSFSGLSEGGTGSSGYKTSGRKRVLDFCYKLEAKHWVLRFSRNYFSYTIPREKMHPDLLPPETRVSMHEDGQVRHGSSVRSYHEPFLAHEMQSCKTCDTLAPTFLIRSLALKTGPPFRVSLDGEWALLDWFLRRSWHETRDHGLAQCVGGYLRPMKPGLQYRDHDGYPGAMTEMGTTSSSAAAHALAIVPAHEWRHLFSTAKEDVPFFFHTGHSSGFSHWRKHLLPVGSAQGQDRQAREFLEKNDLKEIVTIDQVERRYGCTLRTPNCPMDWLYKGWAIPPCCRRTLLDLVFFADDLFNEHGIKYIVTDGGLLGGLKLGRFLDWDGDIDLHIEDASFERLESLRPFIEKAGYHLRLHEGGRSFLLQANKFNYLLLELNKRGERFPDEVWEMEIDDRWLPVMDHPGRNVSEWYGEGIYGHRVRYVPPWEEDAGNLMFCANPGHHNCVDDLPHGEDCLLKGPCGGHVGAGARRGGGSTK